MADEDGFSTPFDYNLAEKVSDLVRGGVKMGSSYVFALRYGAQINFNLCLR